MFFLANRRTLTHFKVVSWRSLELSWQLKLVNLFTVRFYSRLKKMTIPVKLRQQIGLCLFSFTLATGKIFAQQAPQFSTAGFYPVANSGRTVYNFNVG